MTNIESQDGGIEDPLLECWFEPDMRFFLPILDARFQFELPATRESALAIVQTDIFVHLPERSCRIRL